MYLVKGVNLIHLGGLQDDFIEDRHTSTSQACIASLHKIQTLLGMLVPPQAPPLHEPAGKPKGPA